MGDATIILVWVCGPLGGPRHPGIGRSFGAQGAHWIEGSCAARRYHSGKKRSKPQCGGGKEQDLGSTAYAKS